MSLFFSVFSHQFILHHITLSSLSLLYFHLPITIGSNSLASPTHFLMYNVSVFLPFFSLVSSYFLSNYSWSPFQFSHLICYLSAYSLNSPIPARHAITCNTYALREMKNHINGRSEWHMINGFISISNLYMKTND